MSEKEEKATPLPSPSPTPTRVLVRELKREPANLGIGGVTWEQPTALQSRQYPFWYQNRAAFGSLIIVNVCICSYVLFTVKPKPKGSKKGKGQSMNIVETVATGSREG